MNSVHEKRWFKTPIERNGETYPAIMREGEYIRIEFLGVVWTLSERDATDLVDELLRVLRG